MRFLYKLDHLPVRDEIPLCIGRIGEETAGYRQLAPIGSCRLLGNPSAVDPLLGNQTNRGLDLRARAITEPLEHAGTDLERLLWVDLAHRHIVLSLPDLCAEPARNSAR
jgi:hypothetical protein